VQCFPELGNEQLVSVTNDVERKAFFAVPQAKKLCSKPFSGDICVCWHNLNISTETIGDRNYAVKPFIDRQWSNKVNGY